MKKAVFPGSFDPFTLGHLDIVSRALPLFDEVIIAIGINAEKKYMFSLEERVNFIKETFQDNPKIKVDTYHGLTALYCNKIGAQFILRGLRNTTDYNFEQPIAQTNFKIAGIESVFLVSAPEVSNISSTIVRDIMRYDGDYTFLVPEAVRKNK